MTPGKSRTRRAEGLRKSSSSADVLGGVPFEYHSGRDDCADQAQGRIRASSQRSVRST
jgi:hypothetical protein